MLTIPRYALYMAEKYMFRLIALANIAIGVFFNRRITKAVGKWSKVRAKTRCAVFERIDVLTQSITEVVSLILPLIFWVGTADDRLTDSVLTLYAQAAKRLALDDDASRRIQEMIDRDDLYQVLVTRLQEVHDAESRGFLFDIAVTTGAVNLDDNDKYHECLLGLSKALAVSYSREDFRRKIKHLKT